MRWIATSFTLLLFAGLANAQFPNTQSTITIKVLDGEARISGTVASESVESMVREIAEQAFKGQRLSFRLSVDEKVKPFALGWLPAFEVALKKSAGWGQGVVVFTFNEASSKRAIGEALRGARLTRVGSLRPESLIKPEAKATIVALFATWCGPCRSQLKDLDKLYDEFSSQGLDVIGLDADDEERHEDIARLAKVMAISFPLGLPEKNLATRLKESTGFPGLPLTVLVQQGRIVSVDRGWTPSGAAQMRDSVEALFNAR